MARVRRRAKEVKPAVGDRVRFVTWMDDKAPLEGYVTWLLASQFVILTDDGQTHYKFYRDHNTEWKVIDK